MSNNRQGTLRAEDLSVGDTLVHAETSSWGDLLHTFDVEVTKIIATRLTVRYVGRDGEITLIIRDGNVSNSVYGRTSYRDSFDIYTPDDARLEGLRERREAEKLKADAKRAINQWQSYTSDRTKAREAIAALQAWVDAAAVIDAKENPL